MTVIPWPQAGSRRPTKSTRNLVVDRLPEAILNKFASDFPGPKNETEAERAARIAARRAEILSFHPRDPTEAMLATQCIMLGMLVRKANHDAANHPPTSAARRKIIRDAMKLIKQISAMEEYLVARQSRPLGEIDRAMFEALGLGRYLTPEPDNSGLDEEAFSAIIVPLHPAPKMLQ